MKHIYLVVLFAICIGCQPDDDSAYLDNSDYQTFQITCDSDTVLTSEKGVKISIEAHTFACPPNKQVTLKFTEILTKTDMILNRMYTLDESGNILESGGMFQLIDATNNAKTFLKPIKVDIPTTWINQDMQQYAGNIQDDMMVWVANGEEVQAKNAEGIQKGEILYRQNCTACHLTDLRKSLVAPPIGNVHLFRDKDWLINFIRNAPGMLAIRDTLAVCVAQAANNVVMNGFTHLSIEEITDIIAYIANESKRQAIARDEIKFATKCDIDTIRIWSAPTFSPQVDYYYSTTIFSAGWMNVDALCLFDQKIEALQIMLDKPYPKAELAISFQERNIAIPLVKEYQDSKIYNLLNGKGMSQISFPLGEKIDIVAYSKGKEFQYNILEYRPKKKGNKLKISLKAGDKKTFLEELEKL
ncbi:MAG: cytochrome c [Bacteroidota bacterium]